VADPALRVERVVKSFGGLTAVNDVYLSIEPGERRALIGPNGAGKTTLFNLVSGTLTPTSGRLLLFGHDVTRERPHVRARRGLARTFQITTLFPQLTVLDNVLLAVQALDSSRRVFYRRRAAFAHLHQRADALLAQWKLAAQADVPVAELSYGEQRQLEIIMAVAGEPRLLLLDEPTAGLSPAETTDVAAIIKALPTDMAMLVIEHDMDVAFELSHRVTVLSQGRVLAEGDGPTIRSNPQVNEIYLGSAASR
jgi:branched-chain amino acid transport system ATP-binding protein